MSMKCKPLSAYLVTLPTGACSPCSPMPLMQDGEAFALGDAEKALFDSVSQEHVGIVGTTVLYWIQNQKKSIVDPLYNEPVKRGFDGPFLLKAFFTYPDKSPTVGLEGFSSAFDASMFIPRAEIERVRMPASPGESDICRVWDAPYWNEQFAVDGFPIPDAGLYFSVIDAKEDGVVFDTSHFVGFQCSLRRSTQQTPERKLVTSI